MTGALALTASLLAQASVPTAPLSETQAVELALKNSPQVRFRAHFLEEARAQTEVLLVWNNPLLRVSGLRYDQLIDPAIDRRTYGEHPFYHTAVGLRWSPPGLGERPARRASA